MSLKLEPEPDELLKFPSHVSSVLVGWWGSERANVPKEYRVAGLLDLGDKLCH